MTTARKGRKNGKQTKLAASMAVAGSLLAAGAAFAGLPAATGINGSLHDMNKIVGTNADSMGRVCVFCHTPHSAESNLGKTDVSPLWSRSATNSHFQPYLWVTPANLGTDDNPVAFEITDALIGPTRLCMSCHDGVIAVDEHNSAMAQSGTHLVSTRANLGLDLTKTHPIGFNYIDIRTHRNALASNGSGADTEIVDPTKGFATSITLTADTVANQGTYNNVIRNNSGKRIKDVLFGGTTMTCASCHEVHNKENATQEAFTGVNGSDTSRAPNYFLYAKEANSLICLSCHVK